MHQVTCVGIIVADVIAKTVNNLPKEGKLELIEKLELHIGGCASNASIDLEKIGIRAAIIGKVGNDGFGEFVMNEMKSNGVIVDGVVKGINSRTSASIVSINSNGERSFLHHLGANAEFCSDDINFSIIENSKIVFVAGALLMPSFDGNPTALLLKKAQDSNVITVMDTAWDSTGKWMHLIKPTLPYLDYFIPSFEEAEMISGKNEPEDIADIFLNEGVKTVVIKLGSKGCFIKNKDGLKYFIEAFRELNVLDTTGAGDAFAAGFIAGIINGWDLDKCGIFANAVGANCVTSIGATSGIIKMEDIIRFINSQNIKPNPFK
ncbi:MAG: carbohydrate kinase family protein [Melioribacteraceae bacterium]